MDRKKYIQKKLTKYNNLKKSGGVNFRYHGQNNQGHHEVSVNHDGQYVGYATVKDGEITSSNLSGRYRDLHRDITRHVDKETGTDMSKSEDSVNIPHVSSIAVINGNKILMAKRNDSGKWTLPGGHLENNESPYRAACRELFEEAGIKCSELKQLNSEAVESEDGAARKIHSFTCFGDFDHTAENDPDGEVSQWQWIDVSNGLPKEIKRNLHARKNCTLKCLGLIDY